MLAAVPGAAADTTTGTRVALPHAGSAAARDATLPLVEPHSAAQLTSRQLVVVARTSMTLHA